MSNKSYAYLLNVEPSNLIFLKTYNTEFDEIMTFTRNIENNYWIQDYSKNYFRKRSP